MRIIKVLDQRDYLESWSKIERHAVRAIIRKDNRIALVKSKKEGFYKFPGGGIENDEEHIDTLIRETEEETGLIIKENTVRDYGFFVECRKVFTKKPYLNRNPIIILRMLKRELILSNLMDMRKT